MASLDEMWSDVFVASFIEHPSCSIVLAVCIAVLVFWACSPRTNLSNQLVPPMPGHWLPSIGDGFWMAFDKYGYLARMRDRCPEGIFSLHIMGKTHHFIHDPLMANALPTPDYFPFQNVVLRGNLLLEHAFGIRKGDLTLYNNAIEGLYEYTHLLGKAGLSEMINVTLRHVKQNIADLVTFNDSPADQTHWERMADADVIENANGNGATFVEADLVQLTRNFVAKSASAAIFGTDFVENFPDLWELLWAFDDAYELMAANVSAWIPRPRLQRGKLARSRILACMDEFEEALDKHLDGRHPGEKWQDLDNVGRFVKERAEKLREIGVSLQGRASVDMSLLWNSSAKAPPLVSWMLLELYRDPVFLEQVREEIAPFVKAIQPKHDFGPAVWVSPKLEDADIDGLITKCPLLMATYVETLRVYTSHWETRWLRNNALMHCRGKEYLLEKGSCVHIPRELHQLDPNHFADPNEWQAERHIEEDENGKTARSVDLASFKPFGSGASMCKGHDLAQREMLLYTAAIISFYDMQPPKGEAWNIPDTVRSAVVRYPKKPIRVWIKRRELPLQDEA